jgi:hypothetical protein
MAQKTNVIEWVGAGPDDILWMYPREDIRWGSVVVVHEYETAIFLRDGKAYDVFPPGRHVVTTQNLPLLTRAFSFIVGYGETPFKANVIFLALKQFKGRFGTSTRVKLGPSTVYTTELQTFGEYFYRIADPLLFLTQLSGSLQSYSAFDLTDFVRSFFTELFMQELSNFSAIDVYSNLASVSSKIKTSSIYDAFKQRGLDLLDLKFGGMSMPLLEKLEKEDPTYGLPLLTAIQKGDEGKVLEITKVVESMRALGKSSGAGLLGALFAVPTMLGQPGYPPPYSAPPGVPPPTPQAAKTPIERLRELKQMLDEKLITPEEYDRSKKEILAQMEKS